MLSKANKLPVRISTQLPVRISTQLQILKRRNFEQILFTGTFSANFQRNKWHI